VTMLSFPITAGLVVETELLVNDPITSTHYWSPLLELQMTFRVNPFRGREATAPSVIRKQMTFRLLLKVTEHEYNYCYCLNCSSVFLGVS
jgi:hypothetical protein